MKLKLTQSTCKALSGICLSAGQVFFGAVIAGLALLQLDVVETLVLLSNLLFALGFWLLSVYFAERGKL